MSNRTLAYSYKDVLIKPRLSIVKSRSEIDLSTNLTKKIKLKIPLISANMDTVTESSMAIALAKLGGIGILHRYCSIQDQIKMVRDVKKTINFFIENPICISELAKLDEYFTLLDKYGKKTIIVVDNNNCFSGIINKYNIDIIEAMNNNNEINKLIIKDVMTPAHHYKILYERQIENKNFNQKLDFLLQVMKENNSTYLPILDTSQNRKVVGLVTLKDLLFYNEYIDKANLDKDGNLCVGAAIGVNGDYLERAKELIKAKCDVLVIDIAHGHSILIPPIIKEIKNIDPDIQIIAGNVATKEGTKFLAEAGADGIKVNIGAGSICTTRIITGCGVPQFSAVLECAEEAKKYNIPIIADGGHCGQIGSFTKALSAGASTCMLGRRLAGTKESPGNLLIKDGKKVKIVRGMAGYISNINKKRKIGEAVNTNFTPEGVEGYIEYRGKVSDLVEQILGGIKSGLSYCGVQNIYDLHNNPVEYVYLTESGKKESENHGINTL